MKTRKQLTAEVNQLTAQLAAFNNSEHGVSRKALNDKVREKGKLVVALTKEVVNLTSDLAAAHKAANGLRDQIRLRDEEAASAA